MKYLKFSILTFFAAITFSFVTAKAADVYLNGITVPWLSNDYTTNTKLLKLLEYKPQRVLKQSATDNITGGAREVSAKTRLTTAPYTVSSYKNLGSSWVNFDTAASLTPGTYELKIRADKSTIATIEFWGAWYAN